MLVGCDNRTGETIAETCGRYPIFHGNPEAYDKAQRQALLIECKVAGIEQVAWGRYGTFDDRAEERIKRAKGSAKTTMQSLYPGIPDACMQGLLGIGYIVISKHPDAYAACKDAAMKDEEERQLNE
jgi:ABC-type cobalt transport system substrate-binding protein